MSSREHIVRQGECAASLAATCGTTVDALWNDAANRSLRERRHSPHMLAPGDVIHLPDGERSGENVASASSHDFSTHVEHVDLLIRWLCPTYPEHDIGDDDGHEPEVEASEPEPLANVPYRLEVGGRIIDGRTDGDGVLEERVPARAMSARLVFDPDTDDEREVSLLLGHLDPADELSGARQRIANLGWPDGDDEEAVKAFQAHHDLEPSGRLDQATRDEIEEQSGC